MGNRSTDGRTLSVSFMLMAIIFNVCLIASNLFETKLFMIGNIALTGGVIIFPVSYIINDCLVEVYGYRKARLVIWTGFVMNFFVVAAAQIVRLLPAAPFWDGGPHFDYVFAMAPRVTAASMLAFFCIFGVISNLLGGMAADRWGFSRTIRCSGFFTLPFITLFPFVQNPWLAALLLIPIAVGLYAPFSSMVVLGQRYLAKNIGFASGITLGVAMSIGGMATPVLGWVADNYGGLPAAMKILAVVTLLGALSTLFLKDEA